MAWQELEEKKRELQQKDTLGGERGGGLGFKGFRGLGV